MFSFKYKVSRWDFSHPQSSKLKPKVTIFLCCSLLGWELGIMTSALVWGFQELLYNIFCNTEWILLISFLHNPVNMHTESLCCSPSPQNTAQHFGAFTAYVSNDHHGWNTLTQNPVQIIWTGRRGEGEENRYQAAKLGFGILCEQLFLSKI